MIHKLFWKVVAEWYSVQALFYELAWGRIPVLARVCRFWPDHTVTRQLCWVGRREYFRAGKEWLARPVFRDQQRLYLLLSYVGPFVVPTLLFGDSRAERWLDDCCLEGNDPFSEEVL